MILRGDDGALGGYLSYQKPLPAGLCVAGTVWQAAEHDGATLCVCPDGLTTGVEGRVRLLVQESQALAQPLVACLVVNFGSAPQERATQSCILFNQNDPAPGQASRKGSR